MTTKILAMVDALGNLIDFKLMPGQRNDICGVSPLIEGKVFEALLADKPLAGIGFCWGLKNAAWQSFPHVVTARSNGHMTRKCINGDIW